VDVTPAGVGDSLGVGLTLGVALSVGVGVGVSPVAVGVGVAVSVAVGVGVADSVGVGVGVSPVAVGVGVSVSVGVGVGVPVSVRVGVGVFVSVGVGVGVSVSVGVGVSVGVSVGVGVAVGVGEGTGGGRTQVGPMQVPPTVNGVNVPPIWLQRPASDAHVVGSTKHSSRPETMQPQHPLTACASRANGPATVAANSTTPRTKTLVSQNRFIDVSGRFAAMIGSPRDGPHAARLRTRRGGRCSVAAGQELRRLTGLAADSTRWTRRLR
jgi:hypothetical protein